MDSKFYKIGTGIGIATIIVIILCIAVARNKDKKIAEENQSMLMSSTNIIENGNQNVNKKKNEEFNNIETSTQKGNEKEEASKAKETKTNKKSAEQEKTKVSTQQNTKNTTVSSNKTTEKKQEVVKDPTFKYPVKGEITQNFAKDQLVFSQTLGEWVTHNGIDIKADKTTVVAAAADGQVKSIKNDPRYGLTVVIEHANGFSTSYSNLLTAEFVSTGEKVKSGQTIGTVGNTASFEILDEPHLHFEMTKNGEVVDPNMYLK